MNPYFPSLTCGVRPIMGDKTIWKTLLLPSPPPQICKLLLLLSHFSCVRLCATPETAAHEASPSMGFSRQEYWSGVPLPSLNMQTYSHKIVGPKYYCVSEETRDYWQHQSCEIWSVCVLSHFSHVQHFESLWTVACLAPLSMAFCKRKHWNGLPCSPPIPIT